MCRAASLLASFCLNTREPLLPCWLPHFVQLIFSSRYYQLITCHSNIVSLLSASKTTPVEPSFAWPTWNVCCCCDMAFMTWLFWNWDGGTFGGRVWICSVLPFLNGGSSYASSLSKQVRSRRHYAIQLLYSSQRASPIHRSACVISSPASFPAAPRTANLVHGIGICLGIDGFYANICGGMLAVAARQDAVSKTSQPFPTTASLFTRLSFTFFSPSVITRARGARNISLREGRASSTATAWHVAWAGSHNSARGSIARLCVA